MSTTIHALVVAAALGAATPAPPPAATPGPGQKTIAPTFNRDVAPIVYKSCAPCHHPGGIGPFSLLTYADLKRRDQQIADVVGRRYMPPWLPDPGPPFAGNRRLSDQDLATIVRWVESGAAQGAPGSSPPPPPRFTPGWQLGEPDLVLAVDGAYTLPAEGTDVFRSFVLPVPASIGGGAGARQVRAVEVDPGNHAVVHHALAFVDKTGSTRPFDRKDPRPGYDGMDRGNAETPPGQLLAWLPGSQAFAGYDGISWPLQAGSDLVLQLHMIPSGKPEKVTPRIGLYFTDRAPTRFPIVIQMGPRFIDIPPGEKEYVLTDSYQLPVDVQVLGAQPHAHYLGKDVRAWAVGPDGREQELVHVRSWDFGWQEGYRYEPPLVLKAGTTIRLRYTYDNSAENYHNLNLPPRRVRFGWNSADEMCELILHLLPATTADLQALSQDFRKARVAQDAAAFGKYVELEPKSLLYRRDYARALYDQGQYAQAEEQYRAALAIDPKDLEATWGIGRVAYATGRMADLAAQVQKVLALEPEHLDALYTLATVLRRAGHGAEAAPYLERVLKVNPGHGLAHLQLGELALETGDLPGAEAHLRKAVAAEPAVARGFKDLASVHFQKQAWAEAAAALEAALKLEPGGADTHFYRGRALEQLGRPAEAAAEYREALRLDPGMEPARAQLRALGVAP